VQRRVGTRAARYKLVRWASGAVELYDMAHDPHELRNLAHEPTYTEIRDRLTRLWWRDRNCVASACSAPLPAALRADAIETARLSRQQHAGVDASFGEQPDVQLGQLRERRVPELSPEVVILAGAP
jgi:hypothetical protein